MGSMPECTPKPTNLINLQLGWPSPRLFAGKGVLEGANQVLTSEHETKAALVYGPHIGHPPLRQSIAHWLSEVYSRPIDHGRICVSNGASAHLSNIMLKFTDPSYTRNVFLVEPTYFLACPIFEDNGFQGKLKGVPEGESGIDLKFLERELAVAESAAVETAKLRGRRDSPAFKVGKNYPKIYKYVIYIVPTFSNPSGKTLDLDSRRRLVELARTYDALIVSDDVYDFISWPVEFAAAPDAVCSVPPRLVDVDQEMEGYSTWGNTVSNGSFSKIIGPGVRVGWSDTSPDFAAMLAEVGSSASGGAPSHLMSTFVDKMLRSGALQSHIKTVLVPAYKTRYYALMEAIRDKLVPLGVVVESNAPTGIVGGFFTYLRLPVDLPSAKTVAAVALKENKLRVAFGHMFAVAGDEQSLPRGQLVGGFAQCIRLCWAWHEQAELREGIVRLESTILEVRAMMKRSDDFAIYSTIGIR